MNPPVGDSAGASAPVLSVKNSKEVHRKTVQLRLLSDDFLQSKSELAGPSQMNHGLPCSTKAVREEPHSQGRRLWSQPACIHLCSATYLCDSGQDLPLPLSFLIGK